MKFTIRLIMSVLIVLSFTQIAFASEQEIASQWPTGSGLSIEDVIDNGVSSLTISAGEITDDDLLYIVKNLNSLVELNINGSATFTTEDIDGETVMLFPDDIFNGADYAANVMDNLTMVKIDIANNSKINLGAVNFYSLPNLESVTINELTQINYANSINACDKLESIKLENLEKIGPNAGYSISSLDSLTTLEVPKLTKSEGPGVFSELSIITSIEIDEITSFASDAFRDCDLLTNVDLPKATTFGYYAFAGSEKLNEINLPSATTFGNSAFSECVELESVSLDEVTTFGSYAFSYCDNLETISLPKLTAFDGYAFISCDSLRTIKLPLLENTSSAFLGRCSQKVTLTLGENIPSISLNGVDPRYNPSGSASEIIVANSDAYKAVNDGNVIDDLWYGWEIVQNSAPTVQNEIADITSANIGIAVNIVITDVFVDAEGDALTYTTNKGQIISNDSGDRYIYTPVKDDKGITIDITVTATDTFGQSVSDSFTISNITKIPLLKKPIPEQQAETGVLYTYEIPQDSFIDEDGGALTYTVNTTPGGITFDSDTHTFSGRPTTTGTTNIIVTATDIDGNFNTDEFELLVTKGPLVSDLSIYDITVNSVKAVFYVGEEVDYDRVVKKGTTVLDEAHFKAHSYGTGEIRDHIKVIFPLSSYSDEFGIEGFSPDTEYTLYFALYEKDTDRENFIKIESISFKTLATPTQNDDKDKDKDKDKDEDLDADNTQYASDTSNKNTVTVADAIKKSKKNKEGLAIVKEKIIADENGSALVTLPDEFKGEKVELTLELDKIKVKLHGDMFEGENQKVEFEIKQTKPEQLKLSKEDLERIGDLPIYDISIILDNEAVNFSSDKNIKIEIELDDVEGDSHKFVAVYVKDDGTVVILKDSYFDGNSMKFKTKHLSDYAIMYVDKSFEDVESHWSKDSVEALTVRNVINGRSEQEFAPDDTITRAEFATLIVKYFELRTDGENNYSDIENDQWFAKSVVIAKNNNILPEIYGDLFEPNKEITREEIMFILYNSIILSGESLEDKGRLLVDFTDIESVSSYALEASDYLVSRDIIRGFDNKINPSETSTRAEVAQMLYNLLLKQ